MCDIRLERVLQGLSPISRGIFIFCAMSALGACPTAIAVPLVSLLRFWFQFFSHKLKTIIDSL